MLFKTLLDIPYGMANGRLLLLDALRPEGDSEVALPVVLWLHGGCWYSGNKGNAIDKHMLDFLVRSGFVVASAEYRLSDEASFQAQIHDVKAAIRWLRARPEVLGINPERVALAGFSAGAHLAALAATTVGVQELEGESGSPPAILHACGPRLLWPPQQTLRRTRPRLTHRLTRTPSVV